MLTLNPNSAWKFSLWGALQQCTRSMWLSWQGPREPKALAQAGLSVVWTPLGDEKGWLAGSADGIMRKWRWNSRPGKGWFRQYYLTAHAQGTGKAETTITNVLFSIHPGSHYGKYQNFAGFPLYFARLPYAYFVLNIVSEIHTQGWNYKDHHNLPMNMNLSKLQKKVEKTGKTGMLQSMGSQRIRHDLATEQQQQ